MGGVEIGQAEEVTVRSVLVRKAGRALHRSGNCLSRTGIPDNYRGDMQNPTAYGTCVDCGKQMSVPAQFLEAQLRQFQCKDCKSSKRPNLAEESSI
jgi:DNA-directed RNA polymerase subunit RPC12/RpoP